MVKADLVEAPPQRILFRKRSGCASGASRRTSSQAFFPIRCHECPAGRYPLLTPVPCGAVIRMMAVLPAKGMKKDRWPAARAPVFLCIRYESR